MEITREVVLRQLREFKSQARREEENIPNECSYDVAKLAEVAAQSVRNYLGSITSSVFDWMSDARAALAAKEGIWSEEELCTVYDALEIMADEMRLCAQCYLANAMCLPFLRYVAMVAKDKGITPQTLGTLDRDMFRAMYCLVEDSAEEYAEAFSQHFRNVRYGGGICIPKQGLIDATERHFKAMSEWDELIKKGHSLEDLRIQDYDLLYKWLWSPDPNNTAYDVSMEFWCGWVLGQN